MLEESFKSLNPRCLQEWVGTTLTFKKEFKNIEDFYQEGLYFFLKDFINQNRNKFVFNKIQASFMISANIKEHIIPILSNFNDLIINQLC